MTILQDPTPGASATPPAPATRPYTRTLNVFLDQVLPKLYHKVDRSVLSALVRALEGYHRDWVALPIPELASRAGVSTWSATQALKRLAAEGFIIRRAKKLTRAGRHIWEMAIPERYRVVAGEGSDALMGPSHVMVPWDGPMPCKENRKESLEHHHGHPEGCWVDDDFLACPDDEELWRARLAEAEGPPSPRPTLLPTTHPPRHVATEKAAPEPAPELPISPPPELAASPGEEMAVPSTSAKRAAPPLTSEQDQSLALLRSLGVDWWKARKLARTQPADLVAQVVESLKYRPATVRNPAAWVVREIERGGYATPPSLADAQARQAERDAKELKQRLQDQHEAQEAEKHQQETDRLLEIFRALPRERQAQLEEKVRTELARVSRKLAQGPWDLEAPGPMRSQLLTQLELEPKLSGPTPRSGGWERVRSHGGNRDFSRPTEDTGPSRATLTT